jgi:signal transduction histidine kinase
MRTVTIGALVVGRSTDVSGDGDSATPLLAGGREQPISAGEFTAVLTISQALAGKLELDNVLGVAVSIVAEVVGAEGSSILLIDPAGGGMSFHVATGPGASAARTVPLPPGAGICGHVARTGEPLIVNDAQNDPRLYRRVDQATGLTTRNLICVPLTSGQRLLGVLELLNKQDGEGFCEHDLRLAELVAAQVALALENAHLHGEIVRRERMAAIGQTVSGLAHCIKNILNGIRSGSAVVDRAMAAGDSERVRDGWQIVRQNNDMLGSLVLDMLALARDSRPKAFPTDINDLAEQVCRLLAGRAAERGVTIGCERSADLDEVMLDPTHFYRCVLNLASNAVEACRPGGHVRVRVYRGAGRGRFTLSVRDDGEGISPQNRPRVFGEFFTTKGGRGTGLGLPVTRKLIEEMGGSIRFHSVLGRGTRFVFALACEPQVPTREIPHD